MAVRVGWLCVALVAITVAPYVFAAPTADEWIPDVSLENQQNIALASDLATNSPTGVGLAAGCDAAERAIASRRLSVLGNTDIEQILRAALDREKGNVDSACRVQSILAGTGTNFDKAFQLVGEGLTSRPSILGTTSVRLKGYLSTQYATANTTQYLASHSSADIFDIATNATQLQAAELGIFVPRPWLESQRDVR